MSHEEVGGRRRRFAVVAASAVSVVLLAAAVIGVRSWRDTAERSPAADDTARTTSSASAIASSVTSPAVASASGPAFSSAPILSPAPTVSPVPGSSSPRQQSPSSSATVRHTAQGTSAVADESHLNFNVSMRLSPTHVMLGQQTRVTVTIVNAGHGIDPPAEVSIGSMVPVDDFSNAPSGCTIANGGVECPVPSLRAGREKTIAFTVTTGYYPGDTWDDEIFGQLTYADSYGQKQDLQPGYSAHLLVNAGPPSSSPPTSAAPTNATPTPSVGG
jgi:hypothetical protein